MARAEGELPGEGRVLNSPDREEPKGVFAPEELTHLANKDPEIGSGTCTLLR
jgi:hypothetical protein